MMWHFIFKPWPKHPLDHLYGIETSARVMRRSMRSADAAIEAANIGYVGSHPSVFRHAAASLPKIDADTHFLDLGSGKGRILTIASEYPFGSITGVEVAPNLCRIARRNAARVAVRHPERVPIKIVQGDATKPPLPSSGDVILFLYNPFRRPLVERLLDFAQTHGTAHPQARIFLFYYNPTQAAAVDARPAWSRYYAEQIALSDEDFRFAPFGNRSEGVVIWQLANPRAAEPHVGADRAVHTITPDFAVEVVS